MVQFLVAAVLLFATFTATEGATRMTLDVYYESLCPDSRSFLVNQLEPQWRALSTFVDLRLIPFGKASFRANPEGGWSFNCQHGNNECLGNILHACGIKYSKDTAQAVDFTSCLMRSPAGGVLCAHQAGMDFAPIEACYGDGKGIEGQNLVQAHGVETLSLKPTLTFVPWIVMDKVWEDGKQWDSLSNLGKMICNHINSDAPACVSG